MKHVLIVSPHFPPINAPDMQRVRLILPHLRGLGWEPTVLAVAPESIEGGVREPRLEATYPADIRVVRVTGTPARRTRRFGAGNLWWRCGRALREAGERLLREKPFDLVFFSTTQFSAFKLGPHWRRQFGVPYVLDYQDPWVNEFYARTRTPPPGGALKFAVSQWLARRAEPRVLREAAGVVSVSDAYARELSHRYPWFDATRVRVLPFGAAETDFATLRGYAPSAPLIDFDDGNFHHVYTGRAGPDMAEALLILFAAFARLRATEPERARRMRFHFIGTSYAPPPSGRESVLPLARAAGVAEHVTEHPNRVPYFDALYYLQRADALVTIGSSDAGYSASKLFSYVMARRPLLLIYHEASPVVRMARELAAGVVVEFGAPARQAAATEDVYRRWFVERACERAAVVNESALAPYRASMLSAQLVEEFERALRAARPPGGSKRSATIDAGKQPDAQTDEGQVRHP